MRPYLFLLILHIFFSAATFSASAQTKRALVIGLGKQKDTHWAKINGDNDVALVKDMLKAGGYKDVTTLINEQATKNAIVNNFKKLTSRCHRGDVIYIHYSGHGQQVKDFNHDEPDGKDESWIPYDAYRTSCSQDHGEKHLLDDELYMLLTALRNKVGSSGKILVVIDACHSGSSTRQDEEDCDDALSDDAETVRGVVDVFDMAVKYVKGLYTGNSHSDEQWITISACRDNQLNTEMKQPKVGKLTYILSTIVKERKSLSNKDMEKKLQAYFEKYRTKTPQTPVVSGETSKYNIIEILR